jgi:hypothetical protein
MPHPTLPLLAVALLAGPHPGAVPTRRNPVSRIENRSPQGWTLAMGRWVAGQISIRQAGRAAELVRLRRAGQSFVLGPGQAVDMAVLPSAGNLALELTLNRVAAARPQSRIYLSLGRPQDPITVIVDAEAAVRVNKDCYGSPRAGAFILIQERGEVRAYARLEGTGSGSGMDWADRPAGMVAR